MSDIDKNLIIKEPFLKNTANRIRLFVLGCFLFYVIGFQSELRETVSLIWYLIIPGGGAKITPQIMEASGIVISSLTIFVLLFFLLLIISIPCLFPVRSLKEGFLIAFHFIIHLAGLHGPIMFIKDGKAIGRQEDLRVRGIGLAVVDFNSAIVLEEEIFAPTINNYLLDLEERLLAFLHLYPPFKRTRVCGEGVVFIRRLERIRSVIDLRRQSRSQTEVCAYTNDGIEVSTIVWASFSLGQDPRYREYVQEVAYQGAPRQENLRKLIFFPGIDGVTRLTNISDSFSSCDRREIHELIQGSRAKPDFLGEFQAIPLHPLMPAYDESRVFNAVFSQARNDRETLVDWAATPLNFAVESFRNLILRYNFDQIFNPDGEADFPLQNIQSELNNALVSNGLGCYRFITRRGREGSQPWEIQKDYPANILLASPVQSLSTSTPLRLRGIKVIAAGFTDLVPVSSLVYQQRVDNWRASLDSRTRVSQAQQSLEAMQIQSRERRKVQQALVDQFSSVLQAKNHTEEAIAISILQAMEDIVSDPSTKKHLPEETISILRTIHNWLLPNEALPPDFVRRS